MLEKIKNRAIRLAMQAYMATRRHSVTDGVVGIQLRRPKKAPHYSSEVLRAGSVQSKGASPLPVDIQVERDVPVRLRDGTTIYTDVFRPTGADRVPAVVAWSPYGKTEPFDSVAKPEQALSGLQKFEAADPGWWVPHGYAVIQPDIRGIGNSGGRFTQWGTQDGRDGYDLVEWIAEQSWSNGKVGFAGNFWLSISQWFIGAQRPPHLAALAPWEGFADVYRNTVAPGGVPSPEFAGMVPVVLRGRQYGEDLPAMVDPAPLDGRLLEGQDRRGRADHRADLCGQQLYQQGPHERNDPRLQRADRAGQVAAHPQHSRVARLLPQPGGPPAVLRPLPQRR